MARVRDFFAQRGGGANDAERDESPPEAKEEEPPEEKHSDVQSFSEESSKSEGSPFVAESLETCKTPTLDVLHDSSPAHDYIANSEPEKSESFNLANVATLTGGESATDIRNKPLHPNDYAPAECQNINKSVSEAEESSQGMSNECIRDIAAEPADSVISAMSSESLVSMATSFTFGTVVAPLYQQVFGRVGSESQRVGDWGNPVQATLNVGDLTQSYPHTDRSETSCSVPTDARGNKDKVHGNVIKTRESKQECLHAETLQDPGIHSDQRCTDASVVPKTILGDTVVYPHTENIFNADVSSPQIPTESLHLQGEAQEDDVTHDLQSQTTAETAQAQLPEHTCTQVKTNLRETHAQSEKEVITSAETSFMSLQPSQRVPERVSDETDQQTSSSQSNGYKCVPQISHEETHHVEEENKEEMMSIYIHGETFVELKDENTLKCEEIVLEEIEHHEIEAAVSKQEDFCLADAPEVKNWEMMVEEEEKNILTDEEESRALSSKAEDIERVEKDQGEQLEDAGMETASENIDTTEIEKEKRDDKMEGEITAAREEENKTEDADPVQGKQQMGEEQIGEIVAGKYREEVEKELEYVKATKIAGEEELAEETEIEKNKEQEETELENEKHFAEMHEVIVERINAQEERDEIEGENEMEIDLNNDEEAGVDCEDQVKAREEFVEEENPDCKEEILVEETSVIVDAELESMKIGYKENEVGCFEERLDITENKAEDDLSAPVNDVQDERVSDKENTGEGQNAHMTSEMHLYKEEAFHNNVNGTHDLSKAARDETRSSAAEGGSCVFADEPENDQLSHESASAESDSEDEVELYMHCLRAVHTGAQAHKDKNRDTGFSVGKSVGFSISRSKLLSTPMPSISESLDEEQPLSRLQDRHEDTETADIQTIAAALPASSGQGSINKHVSFQESFSCGNISKTLLYATLLVLFVVVAYYYDFLACFGLYVISVIWLCCQGERQPVKNNRIG